MIITGEGGSGGALAIAIGDRVYMLENSVYSVISPEGCASIMWRDASKAEIAAQALKITAPDLLEMRLIDDIVPEPEGGAHYDHQAAAKMLEPFMVRALDELSSLSPRELIDRRYQSARGVGQNSAQVIVCGQVAQHPSAAVEKDDSPRLLAGRWPIESHRDFAQRPGRRGPPCGAGSTRRRPDLSLHELGGPDVAGLRHDGRARAHP